MTARYVIRELTGFPLSGGRFTTDVMVLDRDDCYRVVGYYSGEHTNRWTTLAIRRRRARQLVETLSS